MLRLLSLVCTNPLPCCLCLLWLGAEDRINCARLELISIYQMRTTMTFCHIFSISFTQHYIWKVLS